MFLFGLPASHKGIPVSVDEDLRQVLDICRGDYKAALRMVLVANQFYEEEIARLKEEASAGYTRGKILQSEKARRS